MSPAARARLRAAELCLEAARCLGVVRLCQGALDSAVAQRDRAVHEAEQAVALVRVLDRLQDGPTSHLRPVE